ncbi:MAG TPA: signal peptidase I [Anaerolineales bacterium]
MDYLHTDAVPEPPEPVNSGTSWQRTLMDIVETVLLSVVLFLGINAVSSRIRVESISMQPTLYAGNFVLVNKLAYQLGKPGRGDIIVFRYPPDPTQVPYIKRVIGLPGDHVSIAGGKVYINGAQLIEPYLVTTTNRGGEWTVPPNSLFVMGDNRNNSSDSRSWGFVPLQNVIGKAEVVYWPPQKWGLLSFPTAVAANP